MNDRVKLSDLAAMAPRFDAAPLPTCAAELITVIGDLEACAAEDRVWARQWDQTAVDQACAAFPPRMSDDQVLQGLRALLAGYDFEGGANHALEDCIDRIVSEQVLVKIDAAEAAYPLLQTLQAVK